MLKFGGNYDNGSNCGSWSLASNTGLLNAAADGGARGLLLYKGFIYASWSFYPLRVA